MIDENTISKFGYKVFQPYPEVIHSAGLLHSSMQSDKLYAFNQLSDNLKKNFTLAVVYDTQKSRKNVIALTLYKEGVNKLSEKVQSKLSVSNFPYDSNNLSNKALFDPKRKSRSSIHSGLIIGAMLTGVRYILVMDLTTRKNILIGKSYNRNR